MAKNGPRTIYPLSALRAAVLHAQRLTKPNRASPTPDTDVMVDLVRALGFVQIDTLHVVNRSHYVTLWARLGLYDIDDFHKLIYRDGQRRLYEGWGHAASIIPLEHYRYHRWRTDPKISFNPAFQDWLKKDNHRELVRQTLNRIQSEGGLKASDFKHKGPRRGEWWDWKPAKVALEVLFAWGDLMVANRVNFQRVYDLRERVMPEWVDTSPVSPDAGRRFCLEQAAKALGVFEPRHLTFYAYMRAAPARAIVTSLVEDGVLVEVQGESNNGVRPWLVHRDNLPLLERAADGEIQAERTTFLTAFDSLFWALDRDEKLWGFKQLLESYKPASQRVYGYFTLPILHRDRLVGRFDPKLDRKTGLLHLKALYLEPGVQLDEALVTATADAMRDFMAWHGALSIQIEKSEPAGFGEKLERAL